jgi:NADH-quinone oxidoreductase subunit C
MNNQKAISLLQSRFQAEHSQYREDDRIVVHPDQIVAVAETLRDELGYEYLSDLAGVDYWPRYEPRYEAVYQFSSYQFNTRLEVRVPISGSEPNLPTIEGVFKSANWHERELYDMFGIHIEGHSDLRRLLMPHDWEGHPLRKDYPLGYEEVQFTFNMKEIDKRKPYAED